MQEPILIAVVCCFLLLCIVGGIFAMQNDSSSCPSEKYTNTNTNTNTCPSSNTRESVLTPTSTPTLPTPARALTCNTPKTMTACMQSPYHGWCMSRSGKGQCVPGFLDGPFDPGTHCSNWWFANQCFTGPLCRRTNVVPPSSLERSWYHHPAPYNQRNLPWATGKWKSPPTPCFTTMNTRLYDGVGYVPVS